MSNNDNFLNTLNHIVKQLPGFAAWKTPDLSYGGSNELCAKLAGYNCIDDFVGTTDHDLKCEAVEFSDQIRGQDQQVLDSKEEWKSLNTLKFSNSEPTCYFSQKSIIYDTDGSIVGTLFVGNILTNKNILSLLTSLPKDMPSNERKSRACSIYPILSDQKLGLSTRLQECLFFTLRGKSAKEIGRFLGISNRTVEEHLEKLKIKFKCISKSQLITKCIELGYINYIPLSLLERQINGESIDKSL